MAPQDPENAALLAHIVSQIESNVQFLVSHNYISNLDASAFLKKLPNSSNNNPTPTNNFAARVKAIVSRPAPQPVQVRALWGYNENRQNDDLSFSAGDIIEVVEETNADWWMGKVNGRQALFPSSYVTKIQPSSPAPATPAAKSNKPVYRPFGAAHHGSDVPPPAGAGVNSVGLQQDPGTEQKKNKYGKYGDTMATSAAAGVGFGAGSAIGGGLVRAIF